jgi:hypothetical protein
MLLRCGLRAAVKRIISAASTPSLALIGSVMKTVVITALASLSDRCSARTVRIPVRTASLHQSVHTLSVLVCSALTTYNVVSYNVALHTYYSTQEVRGCSGHTVPCEVPPSTSTSCCCTKAEGTHSRYCPAVLVPLCVC